MNDIKKVIDILNTYWDSLIDTGLIDCETLCQCVNVLEEKLNGGWIPVNEKLPQNNEHILLFLKDEKGKTTQVVGYLYHSDNENFKKLNGEFKSFDGDDLTPNFLNKECVVAWQPLPELYREVENE